MMNEGPLSKKPKNDVRHAHLSSVLVELNGGNALDLTVIAAIQAASTLRVAPTSDSPYGEILQKTLGDLFSSHVGKSPEVVVGNAVRHALEEKEREQRIFEQSKRNPFVYNQSDVCLNHPLMP